MFRLELIVFFFKKSDFVLLNLLWFLIYLSFDPLRASSHLNSHSSYLPSLCSSPQALPSPLKSQILVGASKPHKPIFESDRIEDVDANRLFRMIEEEEYLAVFFCESYYSMSLTILCNIMCERTLIETTDNRHD